MKKIKEHHRHASLTAQWPVSVSVDDIAFQFTSKISNLFRALVAGLNTIKQVKF